MENEYICVYDSGIGGLTTLSEIMRLLPNEDYIYFADDKNCPYGNKELKEIQNLAKNNIKDLLNRFKIKMLVFACNTVTSCCVRDFRALYNFDIVGIEPAVVPALKNSLSKEILVIATNATVNQEKYKKLVGKQKGNIISVGLNDFAKDIESALVFKKELNIYKYRNLIAEKIKENPRIDGLVLGCTHYVYYKKVFDKLLNLNVYDGNFGVAKRVYNLLKESNKIVYDREGRVEIILSSNDKMKENRYVEILKTLKMAE